MCALHPREMELASKVIEAGGRGFQVLVVLAMLQRETVWSQGMLETTQQCPVQSAP